METHLHVKEDFDRMVMGMPKLKEQFITPKLAYLARTEAKELVLKVSRKIKIILKEDGTWEQLK